MNLDLSSFICKPAILIASNRFVLFHCPMNNPLWVLCSSHGTLCASIPVQSAFPMVVINQLYAQCSHLGSEKMSVKRCALCLFLSWHHRISIPAHVYSTSPLYLSASSLCRTTVFVTVSPFTDQLTLVVLFTISNNTRPRAGHSTELHPCFSMLLPKSSLNVLFICLFERFASDFLTKIM